MISPLLANANVGKALLSPRARDSIEVVATRDSRLQKWAVVINHLKTMVAFTEVVLKKEQPFLIAEKY